MVNQQLWRCTTWLNYELEATRCVVYLYSEINIIWHHERTKSMATCVFKLGFNPLWATRYTRSHTSNSYIKCTGHGGGSSTSESSESSEYVSTSIVRAGAEFSSASIGCESLSSSILTVAGYLRNENNSTFPSFTIFWTFFSACFWNSSSCFIFISLVESSSHIPLSCNLSLLFFR